MLTSTEIETSQRKPVGEEGKPSNFNALAIKILSFSRFDVKLLLNNQNDFMLHLIQASIIKLFTVSNQMSRLKSALVFIVQRCAHKHAKTKSFSNVAIILVNAIVDKMCDDCFGCATYTEKIILPLLKY